MPDSTAGIWSVIETALNSVADPCAGPAERGLIDLGLVDRIEMDGAGEVTVHLHLRSADCPDTDRLAGEVRAKVREVDGVTTVRVEIDAEAHTEERNRSR